MKMPTISASLLVAAACLIFGPSQAASFQITDDGQPKAVIVLAGSLGAQELAVKALVSHVKQMSGATLSVVREREFAGAKIEGGRLIDPEAKTTVQTFILLGDGELAHRLGVSLDSVGPDGIVLKTTGNAIVLAGRKRTATAKRDEPTANAVFRFLEVLGCRSLWPGEVGKVVPAKRTITVPDLDVHFTPPIGQRNIRFVSLDGRGVAQGLEWLGVTAADQRTAFESATRTDSEGTWAAWNGLGGNIGIVGGAAGGGLRGGWAEHGSQHPEWFALQPDGTRDQTKAKERWRLCVSNPGLIDHVAQDIISRLDGHALPAISLCPNDGGYSCFCMCDACKKLDAPNGPKIKMLMFEHVGSSERSEMDYVSLTDRYVHYWNAIAERVTKVVPDQLFLVEAYSYYSDPPVREKLNPNLVVRYVPSLADGWKGWQAAGAKRAYWRPNNLGSGYRYGILNPKAREMAGTLNYLGQNGVLATDMDSIFHNWATQGLLYYTAARLSWDPAQTFDDVLKDYCVSGFGAGADSVKRYFQLVEQAVQPRVVAGRGAFPLITPADLSAMRNELMAASKATENDIPSHRRVAFLRTGFEFTAVSAEAHGLKEALEAGAKPDSAAISSVMERRWQIMRAMFKTQPLAVNVTVVAGNDAPLNNALGWKGPSAIAKDGAIRLSFDDDWLNGDQSATRKR